MGEASGQPSSKDQRQEVTDDWQARIAEYINLYAGAAWEGFKAHGRGLIFVNLCASSLCEYLTTDDPRTTERGGWPITEVSEMIASYEPES
jgi:hypothetical protein